MVEYKSLPSLSDVEERSEAQRREAERELAAIRASKREIISGKKPEDSSFFDRVEDTLSVDVAERKTDYKIGLFFVFGLVLQVGFNVFMVVKYSGETGQVGEFGNQNLYSLIFSGVGIALFFLINGEEKPSEYSSGDLWKILSFALIPIAAQYIIFLVYEGGKLLIGGVSPLEFLFFYVALAVAEEMLFRVGLQTLIRSSVKQEWLGLALSIVGTAIMFALLHVFVYTDGLRLLTMFAFGLMLAFVVEIKIGGSRFLDVAILSHMLLNLVAVIQNSGNVLF